MYRAVALAFIKNRAAPSEAAAEALVQDLQIDVRYEAGEQTIYLQGEAVTAQLRTPEVGALASKVSTFAPVRVKLVETQRRIAHQQIREGRGIVLEGRDIGTVVFPDAEVKVFLVADPIERARRRQQDLAASGHYVALDAVKEEMSSRDRRDQERALSPLRQAPDAHRIDTTQLSVEQQVQRILDLVKERKDIEDV